MTLVDSLWVSLLGLGVVFLVLILLSFMIMILSLVLGFVVQHKKDTDMAATRVNDYGNVPEAGDTAVYVLGASDGEWSAGELKLIGVDERTAAMIMAIVSDDSQIPLSQLQFKTIKAID